ncbi:conserved hypothetical protein [Paraburkholderia sacchari]|uniref:hypothetical protein n=1 Tax=Paraburkholderia sacchari TaxID=159450 RepID=UPI0039A69615
MTSNEIWTISIAAYAAVISTFVFGWDIYKFLDSGPKVRLTANTGMKLVGGGKIDPKTYISATAVNVGDRPTTITNLGILYYASWISLLRRKADQAFIVTTPSQAQVIPYRFEPGAQWMGMCDQDENSVKMMTEGYLYIVLYHAHSGKGIRCRLRPPKPAIAA